MPYAWCSGAPRCPTSSPHPALQQSLSPQFAHFFPHTRTPLGPAPTPPRLPAAPTAVPDVPSVATGVFRVLNHTSPVPNLPVLSSALRITSPFVLCGPATSLMSFSSSLPLAHSLLGPSHFLRLARLLLASGPLLVLCPPRGYPSLACLLSSFWLGLSSSVTSPERLPTSLAVSPSASLSPLPIIFLRAPNIMQSFSLSAACVSPTSPL